MEKNQEFELIITDMNEDGSGVGKSSGAFTWFVKGAVPGDRVLAAATKVKKTYGFARTVKVLEPSPDRVKPACKLAAPCGGCQLQQISYEAQLKFKENKVRSSLQRIGGFTDFAWEGRCLTHEAASQPCEEGIVFEHIIGMEEPWRYRNKAQYPVSRDRNGKIIAGFYAGRTHNVIPCEDCLIGQEGDRKILKTVTEWMEEFRVMPYEEETGKGIVRHVLIRTSRTTKEVMVCLVINAEDLPKRNELSERLAALGVATFSLSINEEATNVILGDRTVCVYGDGYITDSIGGISFHISPRSFFQVNPVQVEKLYGKALEYAGLKGTETVWDLYCGVGTISLFMARHAKKVYGVEIVPQAIEDARANAERNQLKNAEFFVGKAEEVVPAWMQGENRDEAIRHPEVICVDPPRKGCDEKCLETILEAAPERIVYVSCDPATLARDLKHLCAGGYELKKVCPVDMFPQTVHIETVCLLVLRNPVTHVNIDVDVEELVQDKRGQATYPKIKEYVLEQTGLKVSSLYISQVKRKCGLDVGDSYNKPRSEDSKVPQCPPEKEKAIMDALKHFGMI